MKNFVGQFNIINAMGVWFTLVLSKYTKNCYVGIFFGKLKLKSPTGNRVLESLNPRLFGMCMENWEVFNSSYTILT